MLVLVLVWLFLAPVRANAWRRLPVFSISARYQPGAAHQKNSLLGTSAPLRAAPDVPKSDAARFDPLLIPCWSLYAIENKQPPLGGTHKEEHPMTSQFNENVIKIAGVLGAAPELRFTTSGRAVATLIVYTNHLLRNGDGATRQERERHRVVVWGMHAEKAARLLTKGSKIHIQGRMTYPTWKDRQTGETRYGAEIVAQTLDYQGADEEEAPPSEQPTAPAS